MRGPGSACTNYQNQEVPRLPSSIIWKSLLINLLNDLQKFNLNIIKLTFLFEENSHS